MSTALQMYFIEPASLQMEGIMYLHEHIFSLLCGISATVLVLYRRVLLRFFTIKNEAREMSGVDNLLFIASEQRVNNPEVSHDTKKF